MACSSRIADCEVETFSGVETDGTPFTYVTWRWGHLSLTRHSSDRRICIENEVTGREIEFGPTSYRPGETDIDFTCSRRTKRTTLSYSSSGYIFWDCSIYHEGSMVGNITRRDCTYQYSGHDDRVHVMLNSDQSLCIEIWSTEYQRRIVSSRAARVSILVSELRFWRWRLPLIRFVQWFRLKRYTISMTEVSERLLPALAPLVCDYLPCVESDKYKLHTHLQEDEE